MVLLLMERGTERIHLFDSSPQIVTIQYVYSIIILLNFVMVFNPTSYTSFADKYNVIRPGLNNNMIGFIECEGMFIDEDDGTWQVFNDEKYLRFRIGSDNSTVALPPVAELNGYDPEFDYLSKTAAIRKRIIERMNAMDPREYEEGEKSCNIKQEGSS